MTGVHLIVWGSVMAIAVAFTLFKIWMVIKTSVWCRCGARPILFEVGDTYFYACHNCGYVGLTASSEREARKVWKP
jgi:hypothetical protein